MLVDLTPGDGGGYYISVCGPKGYGFSAVLVINGVWFLYSNLDMGMIFKPRSHFFIIIEKKINKSPSQNYVYSDLTLV